MPTLSDDQDERTDQNLVTTEARSAVEGDLRALSGELLRYARIKELYDIDFDSQVTALKARMAQLRQPRSSQARQAM